MRSFRAIVSAPIRLSYARSLHRTHWTNPSLRYHVSAPGSSPSAVMRSFHHMIHSFNTAALHKTYGVAVTSPCS
ncbi:hypothetical protein M3J09_010878 [Ascochyta lentis]